MPFERAGMARVQGPGIPGPTASTTPQPMSSTTIRHGSSIKSPRPPVAAMGAANGVLLPDLRLAVGVKHSSSGSKTVSR